MAKSINKVVMIGKVSSPPEIKVIEDEVKDATQFSMEVEDRKGKVEVFVIGYDSLGYIMNKYVKLNTILYIEGELYKGSDGKPIIEAKSMNLESRRDGSVSNHVPDPIDAPYSDNEDTGWINITNPADYDFSELID